ncbi:MFS transporter [Acidovorax sp. NCPPB 2350]|nr:MFS transporter [Acidovorax sp. NCPPB 2350]
MSQPHPASPPPGPARGNAALAWVLVAAMALPMLVLYAVGTLGPLMARDLGMAPGALGWITFAAFGVAAVLSPWAGPLVQQWGCRRSLVLLFAAAACAYAAMALAPGLGLLACAVALDGVAQALCNPVTNLLIARQVRAEHRPWMVGVKQAGVQAAALFAGALLPTLALWWGWRGALGLLVPLAGLGLLAARQVAWPQPAGPRGPLAPVRPQRRLCLLMATQCGVGAALSVFVVFLPSYAMAQGLELRQAGNLVALFAVMGIASRIALTPLAARKGSGAPLMLALILAAMAAVALLLLAAPGRPWPLWIGAALMGASAVATNAVAMGLVVQGTTFGPTAAASGWLSAAFFGGMAAGAPLTAALAHGALSAAWTGSLASLAVAAMAMLQLERLQRRTPMAHRAA